MTTSGCCTMCHINRWRRLILVGTFAALVSGCTSTVFETKSYQSLETGKQATAKVDALMLINEEGTIERKRKWVGVLNSPDGRKTIETNYSDDYKREELIYQGRTGSMIKVIYRILHAGSAMPEQQENLAFDLSKSNTIVVKSFRVKVLKADRESIRYIQLNE